MLTVVALLGAVLVGAVVALAMCRTREGIVGDECIAKLESACGALPTEACGKLFVKQNPQCASPLGAQCKAWRKALPDRDGAYFAETYPWCKHILS